MPLLTLEEAFAQRDLALDSDKIVDWELGTRLSFDRSTNVYWQVPAYWVTVEGLPLPLSYDAFRHEDFSKVDAKPIGDR